MFGAAQRQLTLLWLLWAVVMVAYMHIAPMRVEPERPDEALTWTANETNRRSLRDKPYLIEDFLNRQVAWDSEFYLSVATVGYEDPNVRLVEADGEAYHMSYAFFPFYPYVMRVVRLPFVWFGLNPIAASTIAGVLVSLLGTWVAMLALYDLAREHLGDAGAQRAAFFLLVFPSSFFLATVYTEGLFVGLAFSSLALMHRRQLLWAGVLAALATWTRSVGLMLTLPLLLAAWTTYRQATNKQQALLQIGGVVLPGIAFLIWRALYGVPFDFVQDNWFGGRLFDWQGTANAWSQSFARTQEFPDAAVFFGLNLGATLLALLSCVWGFRRYPLLVAFGLIALILPLSAGWTATQSLFRYVLVVPTLWLMLARWAEHPIFDRVWTLTSVLLLGLNAYLFAFDFWAG